MPGNSTLAGRISGIFRDRFTHAELTAGARDIGEFVIPTEAEGKSKYDRVYDGLASKSDLEIGEIATRVGSHFRDYDLSEAGYAVLEARDAPLTEITRRDVAKCFGDDLSGGRDLIAMVKSHFPIDRMTLELLASDTLEDRILRHMVRNPGDWSVEDLFGYIGAFGCSRARFVALVQDALHPLARRGDAQARLATKVRLVLARDGYDCVVAGEESGYPIYQVKALARGVRGTAKNLIFASNGPKPVLGFADAINNTIVVLENEDSCLIYDRSIRRDGLSWAELVEWWRDIDTAADDAAKALGHRLRASLSSDAERNLFDGYFRLYRAQLDKKLPALIPQVYLHYDPAIVKRLRHRAGLPRQRMDFLLLLANHQRVVIEVDGSHHFTRDEKPSLAAYSEMVSADRELRLGGYEIYRFGANELVGEGATRTIQSFFDQLWSLHKIA
jgi:very-short-patch-repair endonuclease